MLSEKKDEMVQEQNS